MIKCNLWYLKSSTVLNHFLFSLRHHEWKARPAGLTQVCCCSLLPIFVRLHSPQPMKALPASHIHHIRQFFCLESNLPSRNIPCFHFSQPVEGSADICGVEHLLFCCEAAVVKITFSCQQTAVFQGVLFWELSDSLLGTI